MELFYDMILTAFAVYGLVCLGRHIADGAFGVPKRVEGPAVYAVLRAEGEGENLEFAIGRLLRLKEEKGADLHIIIADNGLGENGQAIAKCLIRNRPEVCLCPIEKLGQLIRSE